MNPQEAAIKAMTNWLSHPKVLGKAPYKVELIAEFDMQDMHFYICRFKQSVFGKWLLGVCGGMNGSNQIVINCAYSDMRVFDENSAPMSAIELAKHIFAIRIKQSENSSEDLARKERSIETLKKHGVPYINHLPHISSKNKLKIRTKEEIAKRAVTCLLTIQYACDLNQVTDEQELQECKAYVLELLEKFGLTGCLTKKEKNILYNAEPAQQDIVDMAWKYEAYWVLIWSLGLVTELEYPSGICNCEHAMDVVFSKETFEEFLESTKLRSFNEILDEADLILRYDWACVDARVKGLTAPANLNSSVVIERHKALNWLIDIDERDDWDNTAVNT